MDPRPLLKKQNLNKKNAQGNLAPLIPLVVSGLQTPQRVRAPQNLCLEEGGFGLQKKPETSTLTYHFVNRWDLNEEKAKKMTPDYREAFQLVELLSDCFNLGAYFTGNPEMDYHYNVKELITTNTLIVKDGDEVVATLKCNGREGPEGEFEIKNVCVKKKRRGQGLGKEMLQYALENIPHCFSEEKGAKLFVEEHNQGALQFYQNLGFKIKEKNNGYWMQLNPSSDVSNKVLKKVPKKKLP